MSASKSKGGVWPLHCTACSQAWFCSTECYQKGMLRTTYSATQSSDSSSAATAATAASAEWGVGCGHGDDCSVLKYLASCKLDKDAISMV